MTTKLLKRSLSVILALLLCVSLMMPAVTAAEYGEDIAVVGADGAVVEKHAGSMTISKSDLQGVFGDSTGITNTAYYGFAPVPAEGASLDTSTITYVSNKAVAISAGNWLALKTTAYTGNILSRKPDWTIESQRSQLNFSVKPYYNATFIVTGSADGALYLGSEPADGQVRLYVGENYTVTAAQVDGFTCEVTGVTPGEAFTPTSDLEITATYTADASASISLTVGDGGTAEIVSGGLTVTDTIPAGNTFEVVATPNALKGYAVDSIVVTKDDEAVEPTDGLYGPVGDGETYAVAVTFKYDPQRVSCDVDAAKSAVSRSDVIGFFNGAYSYCGIAPIDDPNDITYLAVALTSDYAVQEGGEYIIYGSNDGNLLSPKWTNAQLMVMTVRTYYNGSFAVSGNDDGEIYLNGEAAVSGTKLYTDTEYTVTAKAIDDYTYTMDGAQDGEAFTPSAPVDVTVTYLKLAYATFSVRVTDGGTVDVKVNGESVSDRISEGESFEIIATPNANRGYELESIVVSKDGEEVEAVDGVYGPAADGEEYAITVVFNYNPPRVSKDVDANKSQVSRSDLSSLFNGAYNYYGIAPASDPDDVTYLAIALTADYNVEEGVEYIIYGTNDGNLLSPKWTNAKLMVFTARMYYNGTFTVSGSEDGDIYLNDDAVEGSVKLYTDTEYTVTMKQIDHFICELFGVEEGVAFTPSEDVEITASYMKEQYATLTVNDYEGGTVEVTSEGEPVFDKIADESTFAISVTADAENGYYLESVVVTRDGEEIEATDGVYGPVIGGEEYEVTVTFVQATLTLEDCEVSLTDIKSEDFDAVEQSILANVVLAPAALVDGANLKVEYAAYTLAGYDIYQQLSFSGALSHSFGTSTRDGDLMDGNTESIRVTCTLPAYGITLQAYATATVRDWRDPSRIECEDITITYGDDLKAAVLDAIAVYDENDEAIDFTADDITVSPESLNASLFSAYRAQEVTVTYGGSEVFAACRSTVNVYVKQAQSSIITQNENLTYGEIPVAEVVTDPEDLDHIKVIVGIDGEAMGYVSIDIPESAKEKMKIKIGDFVVIDIYEAFRNYIGDGATIEELRETVNMIYDAVKDIDYFQSEVENNGFNIETIQSIMDFINGLPEMDVNLKISLNQVPTNTGVYLLWAVSTDTNYTLSTDVSYIIIKPVTTDEENTVELRFRSEIAGEDEEEKNLTYEEAQEFEFGGDLYVNDEIVETPHFHVLYAGVTAAGEVITQLDEPVREPGYYTETLYVLGGNYFATPVLRAYTIGIYSVELQMEDLTVDFDGEAHTPVATTEDDVDLTDSVTYLYIGEGYYSTQAPTEPGEYTVYAVYAGDETHQAAFVNAKLIIREVAEPEPEPEPEPAKRNIRGDFDGDGDVTSVDVTWIQRYIAFMVVPDTLNPAAGDVDGDGDINIIDATWIQRYLAEMGNKKSIGEPIEE